MLHVGFTPAHASIQFTDLYTRADNTSWTGTWVDPYGNAQIASNVGKGRLTSANTANNTLNGATLAGATTFIMTSASGYVAGNFVVVGTGLSTADYRQIISVSTNTVTVLALTNAHNSGETVSKIRNIPVMRPLSEAKLDQRVDFITSTLGGTAFANSIYLRWIDPGNWITVTISWNGTTQYQTIVQYCVNGTISTTTPGLQNWTAATTTVVRGQVSAVGTNPTVVTIKLYNNATGVTLNGPTPAGIYQASVTNANSTTVQTAGQTGIGFSDALSGFSYFQEYDLTSATTSVSNSNFQSGLSPYNWYTNGSTYVQSNNVGCYWKGSFTGNTIGFTIDTSQWQASSGSTYIEWSIDGGAAVYQVVTAGSTTISLGSNLAYASSGSPHTIQFWWLSNLGGGTPDLWTTPSSVWRITGVTLDTGETLQAPTLLSKRAILFTDSIGTTPSNSDNGGNPDPARNSFAPLMVGLGCEWGDVAFGGQGISQGILGWASYNVPGIFTPGNDTASSWNKYDANHSRLISTLLSPPPDYIFIMEGTNDYVHGGVDATLSANLAAFITALRAAAPNAIIYVVQPFGGFKGPQILTGVIAANDPRTFYIPMPTWVNTGLNAGGPSYASPADGIHPTLGATVPTSSALAGAIDYAQNLIRYRSNQIPRGR
jgi:hypothetical protein